MVGSSDAVDDREFTVVFRGYDREQVKAYLSEVETSFRKLERWAEEAKARLEVAEEKGRRHYDVDEAMVAVFAAKDRVLDRDRLRAERIEADAREQARIDNEDAVAAIIAEAKDEARHIIEGAIEGALVTSEGVQYESILGEARAEADRIIQVARTAAERLMAQPRANATSSDDAAENPLIVDLTHDGINAEVEGDATQRHSRYECNSARLPSIGEDASQVFRSLESLGEDSDMD